MVEAIHRLYEISQDSKLQEYEEARAKQQFDQMSRETVARQEGRQEGKQEGRQEGRLEGRQEEKQSIALNLLKVTNMDVQSISQATGLSEQEVLQIQKDLKV